MIYRIYKRIHNKYSSFFKFFFFLRYVLLIFLISITIFLFIPIFFDYSDKTSVLKKYLLSEYNLKVKSLKSIKYNILPTPNLSLNNLEMEIKDSSINLNSKELIIFLNPSKTYNFKEFEARKVKLNNTVIPIEIEKSDELYFFLKELKNKISFENLTFNFKKENNQIFSFEKVNFSNYGYKKNKAKGIIFGRDFVVNFSNKNIYFEVLKTGIKANIKLNEITSNKLGGESQINLLDNFLKFNFILTREKLSMLNSRFRNKNLSLIINSKILYSPFLVTDTSIKIDKIEKQLFDSNIFERVIEKKELIKKFSGKNVINYKAKMFKNDLIKEFSSQVRMEYGRIIFSGDSIFLGEKLKCEGSSLLIEEYPKLEFNCSYEIENAKKFFRKNFRKKNFKEETLILKMNGSINILSRKININEVSNNKDYTANKEDLNYFKDNFERYLFDKSFFGIFKKDKVKKFILEIIQT